MVLTIGIFIILKSPRNIFALLSLLALKKEIIKMLPPEISPSVSTTKYRANACL